MKIYLQKELTAQIVGAYLITHRATSAFRREYEPVRLVKDLTDRLAYLGHQSVIVRPARSGRANRPKNPRSLFVVNETVLVIVTKVIHLRAPDRELLEKHLGETPFTVGLLLNFGSRTPEFWRIQKNAQNP
jgi:hypothetical protein